MSTSRPGTPSLRTNKHSASGPSRLAIPPSLRSTPSLSNLRVHGHSSGTSTIASTPMPQVTPSTSADARLQSSASSVSDLDMNEGATMIQDVDEAEDDGVALGQVDSRASDEESKRNLREQLRKTLKHKPSQQDAASRSPHLRKLDLNEQSLQAAARFAPREYYVLTDAGKPVFISRPGREDEDNATAIIGIMQALISVFIDDSDKIRCINSGDTRITFLMRAPLYYVAVSTWGEPEAVARSHLEYLHLQILSIVTAAQLRKIFERRTNFDLRRLLNGAESFLTSMIDRLEFDLAMATSSLHCLKIDYSLRKRLSEALVPFKMKEILYVALIAQGRVVGLVRPRKHSIHPADIHILLNTIRNPSIINQPAATSWLPVCLPKFNPTGFVNAYISYLQKDDTPTPSEQDEHSPVTPTPDNPNAVSEADAGIALVCVSGGGEFETIRGWCNTVSQSMKMDGLLEALTQAIQSGQTDYSVSELGIPGLRHFLYKSRAQVQITFPTFEDPYDSVNEHRRLLTLYQILHDALHAKSGQGESLKLQYIKTNKESIMGWITQPFELYICLSPRLPKSAVINAANAVAKWVKKEEVKLFLKDAPVF